MILAAITTCKRKPEILERALKSVVNQTYLEILSGHSASLSYTQNIWSMQGGGDERMTMRDDKEAWLRLSKICKFSYVDEPLITRYYDVEAEHISTHYETFLESIDIIEEKNFDYFKDHKYALWVLYNSKINACVLSGRCGKAFLIWLKSVSLQPGRVYGNNGIC